MKLLDPIVNKDLQGQEQARQILRTQELEKAAKEARLKLADSQADFNNTLALNRQKWAEEEEEHRQRVNERKTEIDVLEAKRMNAMIPVDILKASAEEQLADAENYAKSVREREEYAEDLTAKLQDKLDEVGQREQDVTQKAKELEIREIGIENQANSTVAGIKKLNADLQEFIAFKAQSEKEIALMEKIIDIQEKHLEDKETELNQLQKSLNEQAIRLADERGVLARAYAEVQRMRQDIIPLDKKTIKSNTKAT